MTQTAICSGLGWREPCSKRGQCANYVHWTMDKRSQFNACSQGAKPFIHFVQAAKAPAAPVAAARRNQQELFA